MPNLENKYESMSEEWKKEYDKIKLSQKGALAADSIGVCSGNPTLENIKISYGAILSYLVFMPIQNTAEENYKKKKELLDRMDKIEYAIFGDPNDKKTIEICNELGVKWSQRREGLGYVWIMNNSPKVMIELKNILNEAGELALASGLRITRPSKHKFGMSKISEEEGFDEEEVENYGGE